MKLLIIGGTRFIGRHLATAALARDHEVTLFNRGNYPVEPTFENIQGDRHNHSDLAKLSSRRWDVVVDTCGHLPRSVRAAAEILSNSVDRYVFISSQNAYASVNVPGVDENFPSANLTTQQLDQANAIDTSGQPSYGALYGGLKALCEQAAEEAMPDRVLIIRPGLIVGPHDYTDRFTYWVARIARGGEVLAPGRPERFVQFIDARDLAEWIVSMAEQKATGIYNANRAPEKLTMQTVLEECKLASHSTAIFTWASEEFLLKENVSAWAEMPLWLPEDAAPHLKGFMFINCDKAIRSGLRFRPLSETTRDTLTWYQTAGANQELKAGIGSDKEQALLRKWHETIT
ncbi:MAG TPA: NAD-dependent epimerase/dehydratase family protein [Pyrinomonadaceae bacterium]